ncbi:MAG: phosphatase [Eubacteriales bacterium]|nr:phosphatase [Eubacteriales bacterium]
MNYLLDVHTHTIASGHAYNSMMEMAKAGFEKGLQLLGITEHAPMMPGSCSNIYFHNLKVVPRTLCGIEVMLGAELNILDYDGHVDLDLHSLRQLDIKIASLHSHCIRPGTKKENTSAVLGAIRNPMVDIIGHPDDGMFPLEYEPIVEAAKETDTLLEVNNNSLNPMGARKNTRGNLVAMLELCKEYQQPVVMNSDAHVFMDVGRRDFSEKLLAEINFPEELIVNRSVAVFKEYLQRKYTTV